MKIFLTIILSSTFAILLIAQNNYVSLNNDARFVFDRLLYKQENSHPAIKPYKLSNIVNNEMFDSLYLINNKGVVRSLLSDNMLFFGNKKNGVRVNPVLNSFFGENNLDRFNYNSIGINSNFNISDNIFGHLYYEYANEQYTENTFAWINYTDVVPMHGKYIAKDLFNNRLTYQWINGSVSCSPSKYIDFQFGKEKNFFGDGYRSLLLSDNSDSYPFVKATVDIWKVKYIVLYNIWKDVNSDLFDSKFYRKYATTHFLSWNVSKRFNVNLFETVIWRGGDSLGTRGYDVNYLNPIIFYRPVEFSLGSPDNVIMGGGLRFKIWKNTHIYHQTILDEFKLVEIKNKSGWWGNKYGFQFGIKSYEMFKINGLYAQLEYNIVRPFTYSHKNTMENYGHFYQSMTHPLGANFIESVFIAGYHKKRYYSNLKIINAVYGEMQDTINVGHNLYLSYEFNRNEYGNVMLQGRKCNILIIDYRIAWIINPKWNLVFEIGAKYSGYVNNNYEENKIFALFGIKTNFYRNTIDY